MTITMPSRLFHVLVILYLAAAFLFGLIIAGYKQSGMTFSEWQEAGSGWIAAMQDSCVEPRDFETLGD